MSDKLVWIDLETTGLDQDDAMMGCKDHLILEIGLHITDEKFNILDKGLQIPIFHPIDFAMKKMNDFVKDMHYKNGLIYDVQESAIVLSAADSLVCAYLQDHGVVKGKSPICGNNVSFDKNFIMAQMPLLTDYLHYRKIDVSSFKEVAKSIVPEAYEKVKALKDSPSTHRALDDIKYSIAEMTIYRDHMLSYTP